jgi:hypothetical protein
MYIGTLTSGAAAVNNYKLNYVPGFLYLTDVATQLTDIKVTVAGDGVIVDLAAAGITGVGVLGRYGAVANSYYIPLATGFIPDKVCEIRTTNSAAQTPVVYGHAFSRSAKRNTPRGVYVQTLRQTVLANSSFVFRDFVQLVVDSPTTSDIYLVQFQDGHQEQMESTELLGWVSLFANDTGSYIVPNTNARINYVRLVPSTDRTVYMTKFVQP